MSTDTTNETIRYTADVVVLTPSGYILLVRRDWPPFEGDWALPGGCAEPGEDIHVTAARELAEETDVRVHAGDLHKIGVWDKPGRDPRGRYITTAYTVVVPDDTLVIAGDDARDACWWPLDALPDLLAFDHAEIVAAAANR
ncbi:NUDIX domain-containing protein [Streptomyces celluloflavus]|uniref:NUDIX domain-containing protein n=1 Tax=Streptomyces celluloflavus TaxID=58344 RepID=UPI0036DF7B6A